MLLKGLFRGYTHTFFIAMRMLDILVVMLAGFAAYYVKFNTLYFSNDYLDAILVGLSVAMVVFSTSKLYGPIRGRSNLGHITTLTRTVSVFAFSLAGIAFITKTGESYSRVWFGLWMGLSFALLAFYRGVLLTLLSYMRAHGLNERRAVIFGAGVLGQKFADTVQQALWTGFKIVSFIDDKAESKPASIQGVPVIAMPENICAYLKENNVDELWLALPFYAEKRMKEILYLLRHSTITTRLVLDIFGLNLLNHSVTDLAGYPVVNISTSPMTGMNRLIKAFEDRVLALLILILICPLLMLIALCVKFTSRGPVLFKQERLGWDGCIINVYKFRTMYLHKEANNQVTQASANDSRITSLGKFLRRTSLDELPQFINVLQGRMSIVGPRPHALAHNEQYKDSVHTYMQRHRVKPGITGWAQINGWRGETDTLDKMQKRVEYDLYYINNWSLAFDLKIIFLTIFRGFVSKNAY